MTTIREMFVEPTAHHLCDSGGIYGRAYQRNQKRDFDREPQATLRCTHGWPEVYVNTLQHLEALLTTDDFCDAFNRMLCDEWDSTFFGVSTKQAEYLDDIGAEVSSAWNSYNWDSNFDQVLQGHDVKIDGETYVLLQVHGGADVRSGYTDAKLFRVEERDYFLDDTCSFGISRADAEAAGYPKIPGEYDFITLDVYGGQDPVVYDHNIDDEVRLPDNFWDNLTLEKTEGVQRAIEH